VTKSKIFFYSCLFFILGVGIGSYFALPFWIIFCLLVSGCLALLIGWPGHKKLIVIGLGGIFLFLGILRYMASVPEVSEKQIQFYNGQKVTFVGVVSREPDIRINNVKLKVKSEKLKVDNGWKTVNGNVLVNAKLYPEYRYGDELEIICELQKPESIEEFAYDKYLAKENIYSLCYWPEMKILQNSQGNRLFSVLLFVKNKFVNVVGKILPEPQAAFLGGLLYGARRGIPEDLMKGVGIARKKSFWISLLGIFFFVIITGAQASVVRAAIMGSLVLLAAQVGRVSRITNALLAAAAAMLVFNPKVLAFDVGFQLSFAATIGLIFLAPIFEKYLVRLPKFLGIKDSFASTMAAITLTLPLILYNFGRISLVAPLANVLILSVIPTTMAFGFIAVLGGLLYLGLGQVLGWLAWLCLSYIIKVIEMLSKIPWASMEIGQIHWILLVVAYLIIGGFIWQSQKFKIFKT